MENIKDDYVSVTEAASILRLTRGRVHQMIDDHKFSYVDVGYENSPYFLIPRAEVEAELARRNSQPSPTSHPTPEN